MVPIRGIYSLSFSVVVIGTDPASRRGGIGFALPGYLSALKAAGIRYVSVPSYHPEAKWGKWIYWLCAFPRVAKIIRSDRGKGLHVIVYSHPGSGISIFREGTLIQMSRWLGARTVIQIHALETHAYLSKWWSRWLFLFLMRGADAFFVLTPWWSKRMQEARINKPTSIIPNPLPESWEKIARTQRKPSNQLESDDLNLLTIARLVPGKGIDLVIEAMRYLPPFVRLSIVGDGSMSAKLQQIVTKWNLQDRIKFFGWLGDEDKADLLKKSDVFCLPSTNDSFGMGFLEAMAYGLPIVALRWGPIIDVVPDGRAGILVDQPQPILIAKAIKQFMDDEKRSVMGAAGKKWVLEQFSIEYVGMCLGKSLTNLSGVISS